MVDGCFMVGAWWLRTPEGNAWLGEQVSSRVTATMGEGALEIGGVQTNVFDRVVLKDVVLTDGSGRRVNWADLEDGSTMVLLSGIYSSRATGIMWRLGLSLMTNEAFATLDVSR